MKETICLRFRGIPNPISLNDAEDLLPAIETVFPGWEWRRLIRQSSIPAVISFSREADKFRRQSRWVDKPDLDDDPADAMCNFVSDVIDAYIEEHPGTLGIHASAIRIGNGLIIFPNTHKAGKSLLATHLVNQGGVLFSDDVLLLPKRGCYAMATGIAPRLRLPVPEESDSTFQEFLAESGMCANQRYGWVNLRLGQVASLGDRAPIKAIVLLDRHDVSDESPQLEHIPRPQALARLVRHGFSLEANASEVVTRLSRVVGKAECYRLHYCTPEKAAKYLCEIFYA
jgi:hypothetical protein